MQIRNGSFRGNPNLGHNTKKMLNLMQKSLYNGFYIYGMYRFSTRYLGIPYWISGWVPGVSGALFSIFFLYKLVPTVPGR